MNRSIFPVLLFLCCTAVPRLRAQELIRTIATPDARFISSDELGNIYLVREDNALIRYNINGDSTGNFRSIQNGDLQSIDATNPLRVLLYYGSFSKILLLDRMLSVKNELDLKKLQIYNAPAAGMSADGKIWVYDYVNARLKKFDDQLNITNTSNDMRQESQTVPRPAMLIEKDGRVYLPDPDNGLYTFDRFASYINTLEIQGVRDLQVFGSQLVYPIKDSLVSYDMQTLKLKTIPLPRDKDFIQARMELNRLYLLYRNRLEIYRTGTEEGEK